MANISKISKLSSPFPKKLPYFAIIGICIMSFIYWKVSIAPLLEDHHSLSPTRYHEYHNPARPLAYIMQPFADMNSLEKIGEFNGVIGLDNRVPWFFLMYQGEIPMQNLHDKLKLFLEHEGYIIENQVCVCDRCVANTNDNYPQCYGSARNNEEPYLILEGKNTKGDGVYAEITNKTYFNQSANSTYGQYPVPNGKTALTILFSSNRKWNGTTYQYENLRINEE